jgi:hypothetical protein
MTQGVWQTIKMRLGKAVRNYGHANPVAKQLIVNQNFKKRIVRSKRIYDRKRGAKIEEKGE